MKILHLCLHGKTNEMPVPYGTDDDTGGQTRYFVELRNSLPDLKLGQFQTEFATRNYGEKKQPSRFTQIAFGPTEYLPKAQLLQYLDAAATSMVDQYQSEISRGQLLIHAHYFDAGLVALRLSKSHQVPFLFTPHSSELARRQELPHEPLTVRSQQELEILKASLANVVSSQMEKELLLAAAKPQTLSEFFVLPPGLETPEASSEEPTNWDLIKAHVQKDKFLVMVGRPGKIQFGQISNLPSFQQLIIGGTQSPQKKGECLHLPYLSPSELCRVLALCRTQGGAAVNLAPYEPFGLFLLEAHLQGLRLVCTQATGLLEFLPSDSYQSFKPNDFESLQRAVKQALQMPAPDLANPSFLGRKDFFSWKRYNSSYLEAVQQLFPERH